jgi:hypothetical protein
MAAPIAVTGKFVNDFSFYCARAGIFGREQQQLKDAVRRDFDGVGGWVTEMAAVYRFMDETWGYVPPVAYVKGFLASRGWWPDDETVFERWGILLLVRECARAAGVIPSSLARIEPPPPDPTAGL